MLKKLAKYGNSTALVIDKAILELLGIDESSMVRLSTDGKSLIVTPELQQSVEGQKVSYTGLEAMVHVARSNQLDRLKKEDFTDEDLKEYKEYSPKLQKLFEDKKDQLEKYSQILLSNGDLQNDLSELAKRLDPVKNSKEYAIGASEIIKKYSPEYAEFQNELAKLTNEIVAKKK